MSKIDKARRGFLKLMPAAPFAATAAAKEAAASMGLSGPINAAGGFGLVGSIGNAGAVPIPIAEPWYIDALKRFASDETIQQHRAHAKSLACRLDPDIAAMRSLSPSQAYAMQVERCFERIRREQKTYIDQEMERWTKDNPSAAFAQKVLGA